MLIHKLIFQHYSNFPFFEYNCSNVFTYDSLGFLRWHSPATDFETIDDENEVIYSFANKLAHGIKTKFGKIHSYQKRGDSANIKFRIDVSNHVLDAFLSKERLANEILLTLEACVNVTFELTRASSQFLDAQNTQLTVSAKTSLNSELLDFNTESLLYDTIFDTIFDKFKIKAEKIP